MLQCLHYKSEAALAKAKAEAATTDKNAIWQKELDALHVEIIIVRIEKAVGMGKLMRMWYFGNGYRAGEGAVYSDGEESNGEESEDDGYSHYGDDEDEDEDEEDEDFEL